MAYIAARNKAQEAKQAEQESSALNGTVDLPSNINFSGDKDLIVGPNDEAALIKANLSTDQGIEQGNNFMN